MSCELRWIVSPSASCFQAAAAVHAGRTLVNPELAQALDELLRQINAMNLPEGRLWQHLVPLSARIQSNRELAELALNKVIGGRVHNTGSLQHLIYAISDTEAAVAKFLPNLVPELTLRGEPLRRQWDAHGPGLLSAVARLTSDDVIVPTADVVLVYPATGGDGTAHLPYNSVLIEAVLTNPVPELPEVLRLAWLIAQLNNDLPRYSESIHGARLPMISGLAMLPVVLTAAEHVELARYDKGLVRIALDAWHLAEHQPEDLVEVLDQWWTTCLETRPEWGIALTSLDRMLPNE